MDNTLYTVYEAAREAGVSSQWIRTLLAEQKLEGAYKHDGQWRIPSTAIEPLKRNREQEISA
jgi:hypothetical protein